MKLRSLNAGESLLFTKNKKVLAENTKVLWQDEWLKVVKKDGWYTMVESASDGVMILVFRPDSKQILARYEHCPPFGSGLTQTSLTGSIDENEMPEDAAIRELREESGIEITKEELIPMGWVYPAKFSDVKCYLFAVDGTDKEIGKITSDGTKGEEGAYVEWIPFEAGLEITSAGVAAVMAKLCARGLINLHGTLDEE